MYLNRDMDGGPFLVYFLPILGGQRIALSDSAENCAVRLSKAMVCSSWFISFPLSFNICFISFPFLVGRKLQSQTQQRMVCSRQPRSFRGVHPHGRPDEWTKDGWRDARIQGRLHFSSRRPLIYVIIMAHLMSSRERYSRTVQALDTLFDANAIAMS
jgi:hypothetical protein